MRFQAEMYVMLYKEKSGQSAKRHAECESIVKYDLEMQAAF